MADPLINEPLCLMMLQQEINDETMPYMQNAALQVIMDLWDRKVTREEFAKSCGVAIMLHSTIAKLYVIAQTRELTVTEKLTLETIDTSTARLTEFATDKRVALGAIMERLMQCPTSEDSVH